jgi:hypothetical protein
MAANGHADSLGTVHVIVTCTNRKSQPVPDRCHLGSVAAGETEKRARDWIRRLSDTSYSPPIAARNLYAGEHWVVACSLPDLTGSGRIRLWACSAGYGLIPADAPVRPYAATFTGGHPDSVPGGGDGATAWWRALSLWEGPSTSQPRSIRELTAKEPAASYLLALSAPYLQACRDDIVAASSLVRDPDRFVVVSAGVRDPGLLAEVMVPADARLQALLGGTRQALNARIAEHLLSAGIIGRADVTRYLARLLAQQPGVPRYERKKLSDTEVLALISDGLTRSPGTSASRLLRQFRDAGYACEQGRFGRLHQLFTENAT